MKTYLFLSIFLLSFRWLLSQPNCNVFLWEGDSAQYKACKLLEDHLSKHYQFSREFHKLLDSAIQICPRFAFAYREKAAPYVKTGNFLEWKKNIDLAVKYDTLSYLSVRASLRYKFFADYLGTIQDIKLLEKKIKNDIGYTSNGTYHLTVIKALCYKQLGQFSKAIQILESYVQQKNYMTGLYDYLHLGVMYLKVQNINKAEKYLLLQNKHYEIAESNFYLAQIYKNCGQNEHKNTYKQKAIELFKKNQRMNDNYHHLIDQIDERQINQL